MIPALPFLAVVGCGVFLTVSSGIPMRLNRALLVAGLLAQMPVASVLFGNIPERYPVAHAFGLETRESFLERGMPPYRAVKFVNATRKPEEKSLGAGVEPARLYFDGPLYAESVVDMASFKGDVLAQLHDSLVRQGFSTIVVMNYHLKEPLEVYPFLKQDFLGRYTTRVYADASTSVFRISD
jgi:hypothetical protein